MTVKELKSRAGARRRATPPAALYRDQLEVRPMSNVKNTAAQAAVAAVEDVQAMEKRVDELDVGTEFNFEKLDELRAEFDASMVLIGKRQDDFGRQLAQANDQLTATQNSVDTLQTLVQQSTQGLVAVQTAQATLHGQITQFASALTAAQGTLASYSDRLAKIEAKLFHHPQAQHSFNLTIPNFPNAQGATVKVAMLDAQNHPLVTFSTEQGATLSIDGTPGQKATFQMIVNGAIVDTVTLTA